MPPKKRFATISDEELAAKRRNLIPKATTKAEQNADRILSTYLEQLKEEGQIENTDWKHYPDYDLDAVLCKFWFAARNKSGEHYTMATLENIKHSLNRILKSQNAYKEACRELKKIGKAVVKHYPEIAQKG